MATDNDTTRPRPEQDPVAQYASATQELTVDTPRVDATGIENSKSHEPHTLSSASQEHAYRQSPDAGFVSTLPSSTIEMTTLPSPSELQPQPPANPSSTLTPPAATNSSPVSALPPHNSPKEHHETAAKAATGARSNDSTVPRLSSTVDGVSDSPVSPITPTDAADAVPKTPPPGSVPTDGITLTAAVTNLEPPAIGPSSEGPIDDSPNDSSPGAAILITLLLITGARHPYRIDSKYLKSRNVSSPTAPSAKASSDDIDPLSISVYTLKELIHRDWREDWESRPSSPNYIRLIHFGKLLNDSQTLRDCRLNASSPNVVHMTVIPQDLVDDDGDGVAGHKSYHRGARRTGAYRRRTASAPNDDSSSPPDEGGCCRCVIQ